MKQIAIYGKGGIGKSTIASNISVALSEQGIKVLQIGCDPKGDSTRSLIGKRQTRTILDLISQKRNSDLKINDVLTIGYAGVSCIEMGGPNPGVGCAGLGISAGIELLKNIGLFEKNFDLIIYDVLGDVVCGGFTVPIRQGHANEIYAVTSGELMSLYAANNICKGIINIAEGRDNVGLGGMIANLRNTPHERQILKSFSEIVSLPIMGYIPRSTIMFEAEMSKKTIMEYSPHSNISKIVRELANTIWENKNLSIPKKVSFETLEELIIDKSYYNI